MSKRQRQQDNYDEDYENENYDDQGYDDDGYDDDGYDDGQDYDDDDRDQGGQQQGQVPAPQIDSAQYDENNQPIVVVTLLDKNYKTLVEFKMAQNEYDNIIDRVLVPAMSNMYDQNGNKIDNVIIFTGYAGVTYSGQDIPCPSLDIHETATDYDSVFVKSSSIYKIVEQKNAW